MERTRLARLAALAVAVAGLGCRSTAGYTVPAAVINTAVAVGFSVQQRAEGGCYAVCAYGTVCDTRSGYCVKEASACGGPCQPWEVCVEGETGAWRCVEANAIVTRDRPGGTAAPGQVAPGVGVSPATGTAPTLPPALNKPDAP